MRAAQALLGRPVGVLLLIASPFLVIDLVWSARTFPQSVGQYGDLVVYYAAGLVARLHGVDRIYDLQLQRSVQEALWPGLRWTPFLYSDPNTPLLAWVYTPISVLPIGMVQVGAWLAGAAFAASAVLLAAGRDPVARAAFVAAAAGLFPLLVAVAIVNPVPLLALLAVLAVLALERGHDRLAGVALAALCAIKPQDAVLAPAVLALAGRGRVFTTWAGSLAAFALIAVLTLGRTGLLEFLQEVTWLSTWPGIQRGSIAGLLGQGPLTSLARVLIVLVALGAGWRSRGSGRVDVPLVAGLLGSFLIALHVNALDYGMLALVACLLLRGEAPIHAPAVIAFWVCAALAFYVQAPVVVLGLVLLGLLALAPEGASARVASGPQSIPSSQRASSLIRSGVQGGS